MKSATVKETGELLDLIASFASVTGTIAADGKVSIFELSSYFSTALLVQPAIEGLKNVPAELADLSDVEKQELTTRFALRFDLPFERAEVVVEKALAVVLPLLGFIFELTKAKANVPA